MDGFYVAKFKVEKRKPAKVAADEAAAAAADEQPMMINEKGVVVPDEAAAKTSAFSDEADKDLIEGEYAMLPSKTRF